MGLLKYTKSLVFPNANQMTTTEIVNRLAKAMAVKRIGNLTHSGNGVQFCNLYLKRLDLLPVPKGWIKVLENTGVVRITFGADYGWRANRRGRFLALLAGLVMAAVTLYKSFEFHASAGMLPSPFFFLVIPLYVYLLWLFVFGLNSWYSRLYMTRLIRGLFGSPALN